MTNKWVISDTHFQHENIIKFEPIRNFSSIQEHDETIIENWNKHIKPKDKVYHLGDVFFGNKKSFEHIIHRLNGNKRLIIGNHDDGVYLSKFFHKVVLWQKFLEYGLILTHMPLHPSTLLEGRFKGEITNVHGHVHSEKSPEGPYRNVSVEVTNFCPVNIEELRTK